MSGERWRLVDTGLRRPAENIALNRALLVAHHAGTIPHTLRFLRFTPSALVGFHQEAGRELRLDYCRDHGIEVQRRLTGGGAIYFDPAQIGWELYVDRRAVGGGSMEAITRRICEAAARGISALGVEARFRPRNDIEVAGRKVSGTGGTFDGDSILYQGTLLVEFDIERMLRVLRVPAEKLSEKAIASARERVANLADLLGGAPPLETVKRHLREAFATEFGVGFDETDSLGDDEHRRFVEALAEIDSDEWVYQVSSAGGHAAALSAVHRRPGGTLRAEVRFDPDRGMLEQLWLSGDMFVTPARAVPDLEAWLKSTPLAELEANVEAFFAAHPVQMLGLAPADFAAVIRAAVHPAAGVVAHG